ncbi:hypothetical protein [Streptomyces sp. MH13]|uniref:hypothetical protein n=1 Tax=Streptomyces sp. MH13 TaxID=3417651 RepID=UPI003CF54995
MVTSTHETSHRIFQDHPEVLTPIFEALGMPSPVKADSSGPDSVPEITDEAVVAREPALATFSAIVHSESRDIDAILHVLARGMRSFDKPTAKYWAELLEVGLEDTPARETWRELEKMVISYFPGRGTVWEETYYEGRAKGEAEGRAKGEAEGRAKGEAEGKAQGVLRVLEVRGLIVSDDARARVTACMDLARLDDWLDRAGTVARVEELFAGMPDEPQEERRSE